MSEAAKTAVSESKKGTPAWNKGLKMSDEARQKMSASKTGKKLWPNGRVFSPETREKMRLAKLGKPTGRKGISLSTEVREKCSLGMIRYHKSINPEYQYVLDTSTKRGNKRVRRERIRKNGGRHTEQEWLELKKAYNNACAKCLVKEPNVKLTRDHIIAISSGGGDSITNIQPLCNKCNASKSTSHIRY